MAEAYEDALGKTCTQVERLIESAAKCESRITAEWKRTSAVLLPPTIDINLVDSQITTWARHLGCHVLDLPDLQSCGERGEDRLLLQGERARS